MDMGIGIPWKAYLFSLTKYAFEDTNWIFFCSNRNNTSQSFFFSEANFDLAVWIVFTLDTNEHSVISMCCGYKMKFKYDLGMWLDFNSLAKGQKAISLGQWNEPLLCLSEVGILCNMYSIWLIVSLYEKRASAAIMVS